jgi:hypothetical protein
MSIDAATLDRYIRQYLDSLGASDRHHAEFWLLRFRKWLESVKPDEEGKQE